MWYFLVALQALSQAVCARLNEHPNFIKLFCFVREAFERASVVQAGRYETAISLHDLIRPFIKDSSGDQWTLSNMETPDALDQWLLWKLRLGRAV